MNESIKKGGAGYITGVGSALVDILVNETDDFLEKSGIAKGGMTLVESHVIGRALEGTENKPQMVSGGSACNTIVGVGMLGGNARFVGKLGEDIDRVSSRGRNSVGLGEEPGPLRKSVLQLCGLASR